MRISDWSSDVCSSDLLSDSIAGMRQSVSQMRMQRIDKLFAPLPRIVRDLAQDMGKKIAFQTRGGEVELDREMMENIRDPLIHTVRKAKSGKANVRKSINNSHPVCRSNLENKKQK